MIAKLQYISQATLPSPSHIENIREALKAGITWVQLRIKDASEDFIKSQAIETKQLCKEYGATFILNDNVLLAQEIGADGVHLGKNDMPLIEARQILGSKFIIGATANTLDDCLAATEAGADYIGLGPFKYTGTKKNLSPVLGLGGYENILNSYQKTDKTLPIVAIGSVGQENVSALRALGFHGVAIASAINHSKNKRELIKEINKELR